MATLFNRKPKDLTKSAMNDQTREKYKLISDLTADGYKLFYVDKFEELKEKYPNDRALSWECLVWTATIYQMNNRLNEALAIYNKLLDNHNEIGEYFESVLMSTLKLLFTKDQHERSKALFREHINSDRIHPFGKLQLLGWFVETFEIDAEELGTFKKVLNSIEGAMGVTLSGTDIKSQILKLREIYHRSNDQYSKLQISLLNKSKSEMMAAIRGYIASEPIQFYKSLAQESLDAILKSTS